MPSIQDIIRHNLSFLVQRGRLRSYANDSATIVIGHADDWHQIAQLGFAADGSFHVTWPYLPVSHGVVAEVTFPVEDGRQVKVDLTASGRFTAQRVKYSHHASGIAQFSLTGKVRNDVRRHSFPLTGPIGLLFQLQCHSISQFKPLVRLKPKRLYLSFMLTDKLPEAFLVRAGWHRKNDILDNIEGGGNVGPIAPYRQRRTGEQGPMTFWSPPLDSPLASRLVGLIGDPVSMPEGATNAGLVLIGGLDPHEVPAGTRELKPVRGGLAAMYPVNDPDAMRQRLGTIDLGFP